MLIQFLQALQDNNYDLAAELAMKILESDPTYKPAMAFLQMYREDHDLSNIRENCFNDFL
jgi:hypothetical protein